MKICQKCGTRYEDAVSFCPRDSEALHVDHESMKGRVLDGQYEIEAFIAEGGMGAVYRARHTLLGDRVAIKILPQEMRRNNEWLKRFQREGQAARLFRHTNAVVVHDLRTSSEGEVYLVMEYVEGRTLGELAHERGGRLAPTESLKIIEQVASVLDAAHATGVVHRDLKPSNIMLTARDVVKLLDLGIAKINNPNESETALTRSGQFLGTPYYMAPEQWGEMPRDGGEEIDGRTDVYSLGVVVYEITAGVLPFANRSLIALRQAHCKEMPPPLDSVIPGTPQGWSRAVMRAMSKDRNDRQASAGEFARELASSLDGVEINTSEGRAFAPTLKGEINETSIAGQRATPQNLDAATMRNEERESVSGYQAATGTQSVATGAVQASAAQPRRSWTLGLMSSRGCQVSLTVATVVVLTVMAGGYAMLNLMGGASNQDKVASSNTGGSDKSSAGSAQPATSSNKNSQMPSTNNAFMRYHLLISSGPLGEQRRVSGEGTIPPGQSLQFVFTPSANGHLYMIGQDAKGNPVAMPLGDFVAVASVTAGTEAALPLIARIKLNDYPGTETFTVIFTDEPLDMSFASETLPIDGSFRKLTSDERRKVDELRQRSVPATVSFSGQDEAVVKLSGERGRRVVVFDIKIKLQR